MKRYHNRLDRIEKKAGIGNKDEYWLAWFNADNTVKLVSIATTPKGKQDDRMLTANEYRAFKQGVNDDNIIEIEWIE